MKLAPPSAENEIMKPVRDSQHVASKHRSRAADHRAVQQPETPVQQGAGTGPEERRNRTGSKTAVIRIFCNERVVTRAGFDVPRRFFLCFCASIGIFGRTGHLPDDL